jgi:hypothetical protein
VEKLSVDFIYLSWAILLGALSAVSLPLGSLLGLSWQPSNKIIAAFTAYGGGALIAALAIELVAPTAIHVVEAAEGATREHATNALVNLLFGAVVGGVLFAALDKIINAQGGFLRKTSSTIAYFTSRKAARRRQIVKQLAASELVRLLPRELIEEVVTHVNERDFDTNEILFHQGDDGDEIFFIETGAVDISQGAEHLAKVGPGDILGEIALITGGKRTATCKATEPTTVISLPKEDFDHWRKESPEFDGAARSLAASRLKVIVDRDDADVDARQWAEEAMTALSDIAVVPTESQLQKVSEAHGGAPMAIWLGIFLDGIPESFVIGSALIVSISADIAQSGAQSLTFGGIIPYTLIAGLFLANFPEAMSSSIGMQKQGWGNMRVFMMWFSLMVMTAAGAGLGYWLGGSLDHSVVVAIEGLAAGAMLTMIASAMIPEAVHLGGSTVTGLSTLAGFLSAVGFKIFE